MLAYTRFGMEDIQVCFDAENQIRIINPENFKETEALQEKCEDFTSKITQFQANVQNLTELLDMQAEKIEQYKLRAIGERNKAGLESEHRRRVSSELNATLHDKRNELERLTFYYESLEKVEREQKGIIDRLRENET